MQISSARQSKEQRMDYSIRANQYSFGWFAFSLNCQVHGAVRHELRRQSITSGSAFFAGDNQEAWVYQARFTQRRLHETLSWWGDFILTKWDTGQVLICVCDRQFNFIISPAQAISQLKVPNFSVFYLRNSEQISWSQDCVLSFEANQCKMWPRFVPATSARVSWLRSLHVSRSQKTRNKSWNGSNSEEILK